MRDFDNLKNPHDAPDLRKIGEEIMRFIFKKSQENLIRPIAWGDKDHPSKRKPTVITDRGLVLQSGIPPYWENNHLLVFEYTAPHAEHVEYGTPPHAVAAQKLEGWVGRKLGVKRDQRLGVAYAVARKIATKGIEPHPFVRPAIEAARAQYALKQKSW